MRTIMSWAAGALLLSGLSIGAGTGEAEAKGFKFSTGAKVVGGAARSYNRAQRNKEQDERDESEAAAGSTGLQTQMGTRSEPSASEQTPEAAKSAAVVAAAVTPPVDPDAPIVCIAGCGGLPKSYQSGAKGAR